MRSLVPAESLVYLETNDLAAALQPILDSKPFTEVAKTKPDFSALKGVQLAVAVTGFETTEEKLTDEHSVGSVRPRFVAVADTHAWNSQAILFADQKLGQFVTDIYGADVTQDMIDKNNGKYFTWTSSDGRKSYAHVIDSLIYFGNDESAIDKCLAVRRGLADSIAKTGKVQPSDAKTLASGYVSTDGVAQIANIAGISMAKTSSEEADLQSFIARVLPELVRNSVTDIAWTSANSDAGLVGFEDKITIRTKSEVGKVLSETLVPSDNPSAIARIFFLPDDLPSVTQYNIKDPQIAWRSVLLTAGKQTDAVSGSLLVTFSGSLFEPYGIENPELFLQSIQPQILTAKFDSEGEKSVVIAFVKDVAKIKSSIAKVVNFSRPPEKIDFADVWKSEDGEYAAAFVENALVLGDAEVVLACLQARINYEKIRNGPLEFSDKAVSISLARDREIAGKIVEVLADKKSENAAAGAISITETSFNKSGIERRTVSEFGLIGSIIAQLADN